MEFKVGDLVRTLIDYLDAPCGYTELIAEVDLIDGCYVLQGFPYIFFVASELELVETQLNPLPQPEPDIEKRAKVALNDLLSGVFS